MRSRPSCARPRADGRVDFDGFPPPDFASRRHARVRRHRRARQLRRRERDDVRRQAAEPHRLRVHRHRPREHRSGFAGADDLRCDRPQRALGISGHADAQRQRRRRLRPGVRALGAEHALAERSSIRTRCRSRTTRSLDSVYAQLSVSPIESLTLTAGMRYDDHDTFGDETTGRAPLAWSATPTTIVRASYGEGFKAPTLFQLFSEFGNEALAPERRTRGMRASSSTCSTMRWCCPRPTSAATRRNMIDFVSCFGEHRPALRDAAVRLLRQRAEDRGGRRRARAGRAARRAAAVRRELHGHG